MYYDPVKRHFKFDGPFTDGRINRILDKYYSRGIYPELYWNSLRYAYEKTKDKRLGQALKEFQDSLATPSVPNASWLPAQPKISRMTTTGTILKNYQLEAIEHMVKGSMILGDEMGLGKTLCGLWAWHSVGRPFLVVFTPSDEVSNEWKSMMKEHLDVPEYQISVIYDRKDMPDIPTLVTIIPYFRAWRDGYRQHIQEITRNNGVMICDEIHRISNSGTKQHDFVRDLVYGNWDLVVWGFSGTEVANQCDGYHGVYKIITRSDLPLAAWRAYTMDSWSGKWKEDKLREVGVLRRGFALRRTRDDVGDQLPELTEITCKVDLDPTIRAMYEEAQREATITIQTMDNETKMNILHFWTVNLRLTQLCSHPLLLGDSRVDETPKYQRLIDLLDGTTEKVIIWSNFPRVIDWLEQKLGDYYASTENNRVVAGVHGQTSKEEREWARQAFQQRKIDILIANPAVWSEGVNLIPGRVMIYWDYTASRVQWEQSKKRSHRTGQTEPVTIYKLVTRRSIEEKWCAWLQRKKELAELITGN